MAMKRLFRSRARRQGLSQIPLPLITLALIVTLAMSTHAFRDKQPVSAEPARAAVTTEPMKESAQARDQTVAQRAGTREMVRFALYDVGIYPREARVGKGTVVISLVDYTGGSSGLALERQAAEANERVGVALREGATWRGRQQFDLTPGTYRIYDVSRPENRATLIVEPLTE